MGNMVDGEIDVSVIVPVYNAGMFLRDSIHCLMRQSLSSFEVILVDDGSTDGSSQLLADLIKNDSRFRVVRQENSGAGAARNRGLALARGCYLLFLDADDLFETDMLEKMYLAAEESGADVCVCSYDIFKSEDGYPQARRSASAQSAQTGKGAVFDTSRLASCLFQRFTSSPWDKLFRTEFIRRIGIEFQNIPCSNDTYFIYAALASSESICIVDDVLVHYRIGQSGSIRSNLAKYASYDLVAFDAVWEYLKRDGAPVELLSSLKAEAVAQFLTTLYCLIDQHGSSARSFWDDFFSIYAKKWDLNEASFRKRISKNARWQYSAVEGLSFDKVRLVRERFRLNWGDCPESRIARFRFTVLLRLAAIKAKFQTRS